MCIRDRIQKAFEEYCLANSKYDIEEDFAAHRIAVQVVNDMEDLVEEEHLRLRNTWVDWETVDGETFHGLGVFPKFKNNPGQIWRPMPHQGGDTDVYKRQSPTPTARSTPTSSR